MSMHEATAVPVDEKLQAVLDRIADPSSRTIPLKSTARVDDAATVQAATAVHRGPRPWLSASASLLVWGGGQWINRQRPLALLFLLLQAMVVAVGWCLWQTWSSWVWLAHLFFVEEIMLKTALAVAGLIIPALGIVCVLQAYLRAERSPGSRSASGFVLLPSLAAGLIPGWGQILNGQIGKAVLFLSAWGFGLYVVAVSRLQPGMWTRIDPSGAPLAGLSLSAGALAALVLTGLAWVLAVYDAGLTARQASGEQS